MKGAPVRQRVAPSRKPPKKIIRPAIIEPEAKELEPRRPSSRPKEGHAAAMEEYRYYKAAGMLAQWRERWRHVLRHH